MKRPIILWGATGQARVLAEFLPSLGFELVALFDNDPLVKSPVPGVPVYCGEGEFDNWRKAHAGPVAGLAAVGGDRGADRLAIQERLAAFGVEIVTAVHPRAFVAGDTTLGAGSQIMALGVVAAGAHLGRGCIINHHASVDHECVLADGVHLAPAAILCGMVTIGTATLVGAGATVLPRLRIGAHCVIGAGSVVTRDLPDNVVAFGNPARIIRARQSAPTPA